MRIGLKNETRFKTCVRKRKILKNVWVSWNSSHQRRVKIIARKRTIEKRKSCVIAPFTRDPAQINHHFLSTARPKALGRAQRPPKSAPFLAWLPFKMTGFGVDFGPHEKWVQIDSFGRRLLAVGRPAGRETFFLSIRADRVADLCRPLRGRKLNFWTH